MLSLRAKEASRALAVHGQQTLCGTLVESHYPGACREHPVNSAGALAPALEAVSCLSPRSRRAALQVPATTLWHSVPQPQSWRWPCLTEMQLDPGWRDSKRHPGAAWGERGRAGSQAGVRGAAASGLPWAKGALNGEALEVGC